MLYIIILVLYKSEGGYMNQSNTMFEQKLALLTPREKEVFKLICTGLPNKVVASMLGVTERTIEAHRAHIFRKMEVRNLAHLLYTMSTHSEFFSDMGASLQQAAL